MLQYQNHYLRRYKVSTVSAYIKYYVLTKIESVREPTSLNDNKNPRISKKHIISLCISKHPRQL